MLERMLAEMGVTINGNKPYDIQIHDKRLYTEVLKKQSVGAGESYMKGWWDCERLDELFFRICRTKQYDKVYSQLGGELIALKNTIFNQQTPKKSEEVAKVHYNLGNELFEYMLGKSMAYTCGYWKNADNLDDAEFNKYELICKKMGLKPGETILELGCGWGGLARYMAENYGCEVVAMDIGIEPATYAKNLCKGLPVEIYHCDYRNYPIYNPTKKKFDKLVSVGVLEHVGYKNYLAFCKMCREFIKEDGLFLLHFIGSNTARKYCDPWINKYIFPGGQLPSISQIGDALAPTFIMEDLHNFGAYYDKTLMAWHKNLNTHWDKLKHKYTESFHRMMNYYLLTCAGAFRARDMQLWQFVLTPKGIRDGYTSIR